MTVEGIDSPPPASLRPRPPPPPQPISPPPATTMQVLTPMMLYDANGQGVMPGPPWEGRGRGEGWVGGNVGLQSASGIRKVTPKKCISHTRINCVLVFSFWQAPGTGGRGIGCTMEVVVPPASFRTTIPHSDRFKKG